MDLWLQIFTDYTLRSVSIGSTLLGVIGGVLGLLHSFADKECWVKCWLTPPCPAW